MNTSAPSQQPQPSWIARGGLSTIGGLIGALAGAAVAVLTTELIKRILAVVVRQDTWVILTLPLVGVAIAVAILHGLAEG